MENEGYRKLNLKMRNIDTDNFTKVFTGIYQKIRFYKGDYETIVLRLTEEEKIFLHFSDEMRTLMAIGQNVDPDITKKILDLQRYFIMDCADDVLLTENEVVEQQQDDIEELDWDELTNKIDRYFDV